MHLRRCRTDKKILVVPLIDRAPLATFPALEGSVAFWLDSRTICHVVTAEASDDQELFAVGLKFSDDKVLELSEPVLIGKLPSASSARCAISRGNETRRDLIRSIQQF